MSKALQLAPNDPTVLGYCGYAVIWAGQAEEAIDYLERSLAINPNNGNAQISYGAALWAAGRPEAGVTQLELLIRRSPKDPFLGLAFVNLSLCYLALGDFQQVEQSSRNAIKHSPGFAWGFLTLAMSLAAMGRDTEVRPQILKMRQIEPSWTCQHVEDFLNHALLKQEQTEKMIALLHRTWRN